MKYLIVLLVVVALATAGCGSSSAATGKVSAVKTSASDRQFKPSDHMPPEAVAARRAAGP